MINNYIIQTNPSLHFIRTYTNRYSVPEHSLKNLLTTVNLKKMLPTLLFIEKLGDEKTLLTWNNPKISLNSVGYPFRQLQQRTYYTKFEGRHLVKNYMSQPIFISSWLVSSHIKKSGILRWEVELNIFLTSNSILHNAPTSKYDMINLLNSSKSW